MREPNTNALTKESLMLMSIEQVLKSELHGQTEISVNTKISNYIKNSPCHFSSNNIWVPHTSTVSILLNVRAKKYNKASV